MDATRQEQLRDDFRRVERVLAATPPVDPHLSIGSDEFGARQRRVWDALQGAGFDAGFVFSDEHYNGDVPYLGGNTNITIEQVAGVLGRNGFHFLAGLEGCYVVEQLAGRAGAHVHRVEMLKLAGEDYPIEAEPPEQVFEAACGELPRRIALLSPREVIPVNFMDFLSDRFGPTGVVDAKDLYGRIKYEKSEAEVALTRDATVIADAMMRAMLSVLKPGILETQVAAWGHFVARELGAEELGWDIMVTANVANRTLIGKALNRRIAAGDMVHLGVSPKRDGLTTAVRRSVVVLDGEDTITRGQRYWLDLVREAYLVGHHQFVTTAREGLPASTIEEAVVGFLASRSGAASDWAGMPIDLVRQKPYSCVHNAGYTECQEFYGAVSLGTTEALGERIVNMLDVALRGSGDSWEESVIPGLDFVVVENPFAKSGRTAECLSDLPVDCQHLAGADMR